MWNWRKGTCRERCRIAEFGLGIGDWGFWVTVQPVLRLEHIGLIGRTQDDKVEVPWDIVEA